MLAFTLPELILDLSQVMLTYCTFAITQGTHAHHGFSALLIMITLEHVGVESLIGHWID